MLNKVKWVKEMDHLIVKENGELVATVFGLSNEEVDSNRNLISAAPEMLAAIKEAALVLRELAVLGSGTKLINHKGTYCYHKLMNLAKKAEGISSEQAGCHVHPGPS